MTTPSEAVAIFCVKCKAKTASRDEDAYLPHLPKRRTRAAIARERGLGPWRCASGVKGILTSPQPPPSTSIPKRGWITLERL